MEIKCKFKQQNEIAERGSFRSRKVWVVTEENPDYPQTIEVEVSQDKVNLFDGYQQGQPMTLSINLRGREWTNDSGKTFVFNTLQCWKIVSDANDSDSKNKMTTDKIIKESRVDQNEIFATKKSATKKSGNIEKNFQNDFIKEIENENDDLPF